MPNTLNPLTACRILCFCLSLKSLFHSRFNREIFVIELFFPPFSRLYVFKNGNFNYSLFFLLSLFIDLHDIEFALIEIA